MLLLLLFIDLFSVLVVYASMPGTLLGPLHTKAAVKEYTDGLEEIAKQGGHVLYGGKVVDGPGNFVEATIVEISPDAPIVKTELFVPILYVMKFKVCACVNVSVCMCVQQRFPMRPARYHAMCMISLPVSPYSSRVSLPCNMWPCGILLQSVRW